MSGMLNVQSLRKSSEIHPDGKWTCPNCGTKHELRTGKTIIKNRKPTKTSAKTGVKNQMVRMSWMETKFRSRSIAPNVVGKKIVCCS